MVKMVIFKDFSGSPVVKTPHSQCSGIGSIPGWGSKMPQEQPKFKKKKRCNLVICLAMISKDKN